MKMDGCATYDRILKDIKDAMFSGDSIKRVCLRSLVSEIKNQTVNAGRELTEEVVLKCVQRSAKQHRDSIESFKAGKREDLAMKEAEELAVIESYLPRMLSEDKTRTLVDNILQSVEAVKKNMGVVMRQLPPEADRKTASKYLSQILK